ncbi:MAG: hypothetical protein KGN35_04865, partial [Betaproteobacteria bacterium]|nr:hypothetical protein [Betaproteobacteria bacterium]
MEAVSFELEPTTPSPAQQAGLQPGDILIQLAG